MMYVKKNITAKTVCKICNNFVKPVDSFNDLNSYRNE